MIRERLLSVEVDKAAREPKAAASVALLLTALAR